MSREGQLVGLVTVKDVLRHEARQEVLHTRKRRTESASNSRSDSPIPGSRISPIPRVLKGHARNQSEASSANGWADSWQAVEEGEASGNGLEIVLEEALGWIKTRIGGPISGISRLLRRNSRSTSNGQRNGHDAAYEFELAEDR